MGNFHSNEIDEIEKEEDDKKKKVKSRKRQIKRNAKSLKPKKKIYYDDYDNIDEGSYPEFF